MKNNKTVFEKVGNISFESRVVISFIFIFGVLSTIMSILIFVSISDLYLDNAVNGVVSDFERIESYLSKLPNEEEIDVHLLLQYLDNKETDFKITDYTLGASVGNFENTAFFSTNKRIYITKTIHTSRYVVNTVICGNKTYAVMQGKRDINGRKYLIESVRGIKFQNARYRLTVLRMIVLNLSAVILVMYLSRQFSKLIFAPVERVRVTAEKITALDLSKRISVGKSDGKMQELIETFNSMIERLEVSFKNQSQFISDVSHELKTPLSVIDGYINLMRRWGDKHPEIMDEGIDNISRESEHMSHMIKNLLFIARSEQGKIQAEMCAVSPSSAVSGVINEMKIIYPDVEINFKCNSDAEIYADYNMIKQLLWIYADNAVKYTKYKGIITFRTEEKDDKYYISIEDNGKGIKAEDIPFIFKRSFRSDKPENSGIEGTGLGLSIAKEIVESFGGNVYAESNPMVKTVFVNSFPIYKSKRKA
jgi:signal transduction histidine kinase